MRQIKGHEQKKCFYCNSSIIKKNGIRNENQHYKCYSFRKQYIGGNRLNSSILWNEYVLGKQSYAQLAAKYYCSIRTIQRKIDAHIVTLKKVYPSQVIVLTDTTYWGKEFGVMLFKDAITKQNLIKFFVKTKTNAKFIEGIRLLQSRRFEVQAIICYGRKAYSVLCRYIYSNV